MFRRNAVRRRPRRGSLRRAHASWLAATFPGGQHVVQKFFVCRLRFSVSGVENFAASSVDSGDDQSVGKSGGKRC